jgi:hypothetical protein
MATSRARPDSRAAVPPLVFFLVVAMDRRFAGKESISPAPFEVAIGNMQEWDSVIAPATGVKK